MAWSAYDSSRTCCNQADEARTARISRVTRTVRCRRVWFLVCEPPQRGPVVNANEPESDTEGAEDYFRPLFAVAREADPTRPVGFVNVRLAPHGKCRVSQFADVLRLNRYYA